MTHPDLNRIVHEDGNIRSVMKGWPINRVWLNMLHAWCSPPDRLALCPPARAAVMSVEGELTIRRIDDAMRAQKIDVGKARDAYDDVMMVVSAAPAEELPFENLIAAFLPIDHSTRQVKYLTEAELGQLPRCNLAHTSAAAIENDLRSLFFRQLVKVV